MAGFEGRYIPTFILLVDTVSTFMTVKVDTIKVSSVNVWNVYRVCQIKSTHFSMLWYQINAFL